MVKVIKIENEDDRDFCPFCKAVYTSAENTRLENCINGCKQEIESYEPVPETLALIEHGNRGVEAVTNDLDRIQLLLALSGLVERVVGIKTAIERILPDDTRLEELKTSAVTILGHHEGKLYELAETIADDNSRDTLHNGRRHLQIVETSIEEISHLINMFTTNRTRTTSLDFAVHQPDLTRTRTLDISIFPVYNSSDFLGIPHIPRNRIQVRRSVVAPGEPIGVYYGNDARVTRAAGTVLWFTEMIVNIEVGTFVLHMGDCIGRILQTREVQGGQILTVMLDLHNRMRYDPVARHAGEIRANQVRENFNGREFDSISVDGLLRLRFSASEYGAIPIGTIVRREGIDIGMVVESDGTNFIIEIDTNSPMGIDIGMVVESDGTNFIIEIDTNSPMAEYIDALGVNSQFVLSPANIIEMHLSLPISRVEMETTFREASLTERQLHLRDIEELLGTMERDFDALEFVPSMSFTERFAPTLPPRANDVIRGLSPDSIIQDDQVPFSLNLTVPDDATIGADTIDMVSGRGHTISHGAEIAQDDREPEVSEEERTHE